MKNLHAIPDVILPARYLKPLVPGCASAYQLASWDAESPPKLSLAQRYLVKIA